MICRAYHGMYPQIRKKVFLILMFPVPYIVSLFFQNLTYLFRCSRKINVPVLLPPPPPGGLPYWEPRGGGYSHFSSYVGSGPASIYRSPPPPKMSGISSTPPPVQSAIILTRTLQYFKMTGYINIVMPCCFGNH